MCQRNNDKKKGNSIEYIRLQIYANRVYIGNYSVLQYFSPFRRACSYKILTSRYTTCSDLIRYVIPNRNVPANEFCRSSNFHRTQVYSNVCTVFHVFSVSFSLFPPLPLPPFPLSPNKRSVCKALNIYAIVRKCMKRAKSMLRSSQFRVKKIQLAHGQSFFRKTLVFVEGKKKKKNRKLKNCLNDEISLGGQTFRNDGWRCRARFMKLIVIE